MLTMAWKETRVVHWLLKVVWQVLEKLLAGNGPSIFIFHVLVLVTCLVLKWQTSSFVFFRNTLIMPLIDASVVSD